uniref:Uncharacterized protein n=1 Tax=Ditylum brightwellii TaxID=49249 RepID=A0A7S4SQR6_9STRA|mmetsp:Transcript_27931/g.41758  ORF Transcript_27931/g.41758 Transcript_27931/m.41758 type:complete len:125 (+) Transcript_27931:159-533(+)
MENTIYLTGSDGEDTPAAECVYIVFSQEETVPKSVYSGSYNIESPRNLNKRCIGVYRRVDDANEAALDYWYGDLGFVEDDDGDETEVAYDDNLVNLFWDGRSAGDRNTLSQRVYVEKQDLLSEL